MIISCSTLLSIKWSTFASHSFLQLSTASFTSTRLDISTQISHRHLIFILPQNRPSSLGRIDLPLYFCVFVGLQFRWLETTALPTPTFSQFSLRPEKFLSKQLLSLPFSIPDGEMLSDAAVIFCLSYYYGLTGFLALLFAKPLTLSSLCRSHSLAAVFTPVTVAIIHFTDALCSHFQ